MNSILLAEVLKQGKLPTARLLVAGVWGVGVTIVLVMGLAHASGQMSLQSLFGLNGGLAAWNAYWSVVCAFVPPALAAWGSGFEQAFDTWKTVLVRHGRRWPFVIAKRLVAFGWVALLGLGSVTLWLLMACLLGVIFGSVSNVDSAGVPGPAAQGLATTVKTACFIPLVQWVALRSRGNGTLSGTLVGIAVPLSCRVIAGAWPAFDRLTPDLAVDAIVHQLRHDAAAALWLNRTGFELLPAAVPNLILLAWVLIPLGASLWFFERKDI